LDRLTMPLPAPSVSVSPDELRHHLRTTVVVATFRRPQGFDDGASLGGRIRGALGVRLAELAERADARAERRALFGQSSAYTALFGRPLQAPAALGTLFHNPSRPFVLDVTSSRNRIAVAIRLFGFAAVWSAEVAEGLAIALSEGIAIAPGARARARITPEEVKIRRELPPPRLGGSQEALILMRTPTRLARGPALAFDTSAVLSSMTARVAAVAAWHGIVLAVDAPALLDSAARIRITPIKIEATGWRRIAVRSGPRQVPMAGFVGSFWLFGELGPFVPFIELIELTHLGSYTSFGLGGVEVVAIR
jgi:hypothetical protein